MNLIKIKILHVQVSPVFSGAVKFSFDILSNLDKEKYDPYIIYSNTEPVNQNLKDEFIKRFEQNGIKTIGSKYLKRKISFADIRSVFELYYIIKGISPDIVNSISSKPWIICSLLSLFVKRPRFIHTIQGLSWHSGISFFKRKFYYFLEWFAALGNDKIVFVNRLYMKDFKYFADKSVYIPNCLEFRKADSFSNEESVDVRLLFIGRIDPQKDILTLLKAFNLVVRKSLLINIYLDIVGDDTIGEGHELLKAKEFIAKNPGLSRLVRFHGWHSNIDPFLAKSNIFISTSIYEGFGIVFLEAGNYYLPVISTNVDGIPEVVRHGSGGLLAHKYDYIQIAEYIETLCLDKTLRLKMGQSHGSYVRTNFSKDLIVSKYDELYTNLTKDS